MNRTSLRFGAIALLFAFVAGCGSGSVPSQPTSDAIGKKTAAIKHPHAATQAILSANSADQSILGFDLPTSGGNIAPDQDITGSNTQMDAGPNFLAVGTTNVYEAATNSDYIRRFGRGATGNISPNLTLNTSSRMGYNIGGIALDSSAELWVARWVPLGAPSLIDEYAAGAHGAATPIATITGSNTKLAFPEDLAFDSSDNLYVSNSDASILVFAAGSSGNVAPTRTISGSNTQLGSGPYGTPLGITVDTSTYYGGRIIVAQSNGNVIVFAAGAHGNATPSAVITRVSNPVDVATDSLGNIWVAGASNRIFEFAPGANGYATPLTTIIGTSTKLNSPASIVTY